LAVFEDALESGDRLATEDSPQHLHGEEEAIAPGDPAPVIQGATAGRNHTMQMGMMLEFLTAGMEHAKEAVFGVRDQRISELNTLPADTPLPRFKCGLATALAGLGARVARYAFPVRLLHSRLHAGLSRRYPGLSSLCASRPNASSHPHIPTHPLSSRSPGFLNTPLRTAGHARKLPGDAGSCSVINGAAFRAFEPNEERRGLPIIKIAELKAGVTAQTRFSDVEMPDKYGIDNEDMLFSWSGNRDTSIDIFVWNQGPAWRNQHIFRVVPNSEHERAFVLMTLRSFLPVFAEVARNKQTTGLGHVTVEDLKRLLAVQPPKSVLIGWNTLVEPLLARSFGLEGENNTLAALRDTLLPKLISGELRVKGAERIAGVA
jgi:hypothetical protein